MLRTTSNVFYIPFFNSQLFWNNSRACLYKQLQSNIKQSNTKQSNIKQSNIKQRLKSNLNVKTVCWLESFQDNKFFWN